MRFQFLLQGLDGHGQRRLWHSTQKSDQFTFWHNARTCAAGHPHHCRSREPTRKVQKNPQKLFVNYLK